MPPDVGRDGPRRLAPAVQRGQHKGVEQPESLGPRALGAGWGGVWMARTGEKNARREVA